MDRWFRQLGYVLRSAARARHRRLISVEGRNPFVRPQVRFKPHCYSAKMFPVYLISTTGLSSSLLTNDMRKTRSLSNALSKLYLESTRFAQCCASEGVDNPTCKQANNTAVVGRCPPENVKGNASFFLFSLTIRNFFVTTSPPFRLIGSKLVSKIAVCLS
jgi:hypothetical protein